MKLLFITGRYMKTAMAIFFSIFITSCIATTPIIYYQVSDNYNTLEIKKVGILVASFAGTVPHANYCWKGSFESVYQNDMVLDGTVAPPKGKP